MTFPTTATTATIRVPNQAVCFKCGERFTNFYMEDWTHHTLQLWCEPCGLVSVFDRWVWRDYHEPYDKAMAPFQTASGMEAEIMRLLSEPRGASRRRMPDEADYFYEVPR